MILSKQDVEVLAEVIKLTQEAAALRSELARVKDEVVFLRSLVAEKVGAAR